jgi:DNA gyrase subunit A
MIITEKGLTIRLPISDLRIMGRATQGVRLINLKEDDAIASIARVDIEERDSEVSLDTETAEDLYDDEINPDFTSEDQNGNEE